MNDSIVYLSACADAASFRLYLCDAGLLRKPAGAPAQAVRSSADLCKEFRSAMTEKYVF